jgi:RNA polymerase sigma factor (TIGR02999 family)
MNTDACRAEAGEITHCLHEWRLGNRKVENELFELVFPDLCRLANYILKAERGTSDLDPEDLVNQVYFRLAAAKDRDWQGRRHFFAVATRAMRRHIIDCVRRRRNVRFVSLEEVARVATHDSVDLEVRTCIRNLLDELAHIRPNWRMIVELKYYLGLTDREAAQRMGIKVRSMQRTWRAVRHWLYERVGAAGS